jgi:hypothetical protein
LNSGAYLERFTDCNGIHLLPDLVTKIYFFTTL